MKKKKKKKKKSQEILVELSQSFSQTVPTYLIMNFTVQKLTKKSSVKEIHNMTNFQNGISITTVI